MGLRNANNDVVRNLKIERQETRDNSKKARATTRGEGTRNRDHGKMATHVKRFERRLRETRICAMRQQMPCFRNTSASRRSSYTTSHSLPFRSKSQGDAPAESPLIIVLSNAQAVKDIHSSGRVLARLSKLRLVCMLSMTTPSLFGVGLVYPASCFGLPHHPCYPISSPIPSTTEAQAYCLEG